MKHPKEMNGLEFLTAMCEGNIPPASISETIPMQPIEVAEGYIKFEVQADHRHLNHTLLEVGVGYGTIDLNIKMCRPIPKNQKLTAIGNIINISKNLGISEGKIVDADGKLYAHATATCMIIRP